MKESKIVDRNSYSDWALCETRESDEKNKRISVILEKGHELLANGSGNIFLKEVINEFDKSGGAKVLINPALKIYNT